MIGTQIKALRKSLDISQDEFGKRLGVTGGAISLIEKGDRSLTDQMRIAICQTFGVNPVWLETGDGDPFQNNASHIDKLIDGILSDKKETAKTVFKALARMDNKKWDALVDIILSLSRDLKAEEPEQE